MSDMIAYESRYGSIKRLHLTGKCKTKTIIDNTRWNYCKYDYAQNRVHFLGIPLWLEWIDKTYIFYQKEVEEFYDCDELKS
jgi:hypothetical protein